MTGFASGDGSFMIILRTDDAYLAGSRVEVAFSLTQHDRDIKLMECFVSYFECGQCYSFKKHDIFRCRNSKDIREKILPFFLKYPILGVKSKDFSVVFFSNFFFQQSW